MTASLETKQHRGKWNENWPWEHQSRSKAHDTDNGELRLRRRSIRRSNGRSIRRNQRERIRSQHTEPLRTIHPGHRQLRSPQKAGQGMSTPSTEHSEVRRFRISKALPCHITRSPEGPVNQSKSNGNAADEARLDTLDTLGEDTSPSQFIEDHLDVQTI